MPGLLQLMRLLGLTFTLSGVPVESISAFPQRDGREKRPRVLTVDEFRLSSTHVPAGVGQSCPSNDPDDQDPNQPDIFSSSSYDVPFETLVKKLRELLAKIRDQGNCWQEDKILCHYQILVNLLHQLISNHNAIFDRNPRNPGNITLVVGQVRIEFDEAVRDVLRPVTQTPRSSNEMTEPVVGVIYRIYCTEHPDFNYVGQTVRDASVRNYEHANKIARDATRDLKDLSWRQPGSRRSPLCRHATELHSYLSTERNETPSFYEYEVLHEMCPEQKTGAFLRPWEIFFQWLFRAHVNDGGASRK